MPSFGNERLYPPVGDVSMKTNMAPILEYVVGSPKRVLAPVALAEKWEVAPDGLSWSFYIRKGIKFHNGEDLNADDVKFSIEAQMAPEASDANMRNTVDKVELLDDYTVRVYTKDKRPFFPWLLAMETPSAGEVMPKDYIQQNGIPYYERNPVGTGPFRFVKFIPGDMLQYEGLAAHWRLVPEFKKLTLIVIPEESTREAALKVGQLDAVEIGLESAGSIEKEGFQISLLDTNTPMIQLMGAYDPRAVGMPTTDIRVRQTLSLAIDRDDIRQNFFYGKAGPPLPAHLGESAVDIDVPYWLDYAAKLYRYDPVEAKKLLQEAGYANGFTFKLYTWSDSGRGYLPKLAEVIASYWLNIGVRAEITPIDSGTWTTLRRGPAPAGVRGPAPQLVGQATTWARISSAMTHQILMTAYHPTGSVAMFGYTMPELTRILEDIQSEIDQAKRRELIAKAVKMATDTYVAFQICSVPAYVAISPKVDWVLPAPLAFPSLPAFAEFAKHK